MTDEKVLYKMMMTKSPNWTWTFRRVKALEHAVKALREEKPECVLKQNKKCIYTCSVCDGTIKYIIDGNVTIIDITEMKYCPYCGAKVRDIKGGDADGI